MFFILFTFNTIQQNLHVQISSICIVIGLSIFIMENSLRLLQDRKENRLDIIAKVRTKSTSQSHIHTQLFFNCFRLFKKHKITLLY